MLFSSLYITQIAFQSQFLYFSLRLRVFSALLLVFHHFARKRYLQISGLRMCRVT